MVATFTSWHNAGMVYFQEYFPEYGKKGREEDGFWKKKAN
jgi:hypothetical protein